jgi:hypothetical protein
MDMDPIIASALDIYADESTVKNAEGDTLSISTSNEEVRKVLHNLFYDILNIDYNLWPWVRNACKYGDFFLHLDIEDELGVINVTPLSAYEVRREDGYDMENPYVYRFVIEGPSGTYANFAGKPDRNEFESFQIAHFRLLSDTNFLPYGKSMIESGRKLFKQLSLMEDAMLIQRIMRAPERRVFKIDVGNIPPHEVDNYMNQIMSKMKKVPYMNEQTGDYNLKFNLQNMMEDYYLPVRGGESGTAIDTLAGLTNEGQIEDIEYLRNKLHAALKIPKAFLGYDEGVEGKATLAAEDVRFARTIERIQKIFISELTKIGIIHLYAQGFRDEDLIGFSLELNNPSLIYEKQQLESLTTKVELAGKLRESQLFSEQWIYENIFGMTEYEWKSQQDNVIEDLKTQFRRKQIADEGNDPKKTNMSFGTPHDIASMHVATKGELLPGMEQEHVAGPGRPKDLSTWGKHSSPHGRDPLGAKQLSSTFNGSPKTDPLQHTYRKSSPLSIESIESKELIKTLSNKFKNTSIIQESLDKNTTDSDAGTMLDESQLLSLND